MWSFSYQNCSDPNKGQLFVINSLSVSPDLIKLPGMINLSFGIDVKGDVQSPLKAEVKMWKNVLGIWFEIPCINNLGSCTYDDFCTILSYIQSCPGPLTQRGIPCQCPFKMGNYNLPQTSFDIEVSLPVPLGDVKVEVQMSYNQTNVLCYILEATIDTIKG